jgi:hypothetical protein
MSFLLRYIVIQSIHITMKFETKISGNSVTVFNVSKKNHDIETDFLIEWVYETEMRSWGVKSTSLYINKIVGQVVVDFWEEENTKKQTHLIDTDLENYDGTKWSVEVDDSDLNFKNHIQPQDLYIDFSNKIISVNF